MRKILDPTCEISWTLLKLLRIWGSHDFLQRGQQHTTVPVHSNRNLKTGTLPRILRDIDLSPAAFTKMWEGRRRHQIWG